MIAVVFWWLETREANVSGRPLRLMRLDSILVLGQDGLQSFRIRKV